MSALALYIEKCGCVVNSEFYRDSCELLLEQVFLRDRCEKLVRSISELAKSLGLYVKLLPSQSHFITKTIRLLLESGYLGFYTNCGVDLLADISAINPEIGVPTALIYKWIKKSITSYKRGAFGKICQYFHLQVVFNGQVAFQLIDTGILVLLLDRGNNPECFDDFEYDCFSVLLNQIISLTLVERFDFWLGSIFESVTLNGGERGITPEFSNSIELSNSTFSLNDLRDNLQSTTSLRPIMVLMLLGPLGQNLHQLTDLDGDNLSKFLEFAIRICVNISVEKCNDRKFYLTGFVLFRGLVRYFSARKEGNESILEPFDSQMISVISSALRCSEGEGGDPLYAACAFGALFSLVSSRSDIQEDLKAGKGRIYAMIKKSFEILMEHEVRWEREDVYNLILLSIILGFCNLKRCDFDLCVINSGLPSLLSRRIGDCLISYNSGSLEKNIRLSLSASDRLLLIETILCLGNVKVIDGIISVLIGMNPESTEEVCILSMKLFAIDGVDWNSVEGLSQLLSLIMNFGLEKRDPLAIESIMCLSHYKSVNLYLERLSREFLSSNFSDFDSQYGLAALKAKYQCMNEMPGDQSVLFAILDSN